MQNLSSIENWCHENESIVKQSFYCSAAATLVTVATLALRNYNAAKSDWDLSKKEIVALFLLAGAQGLLYLHYKFFYAPKSALQVSNKQTPKYLKHSAIPWNEGLARELFLNLYNFSIKDGIGSGDFKTFFIDGKPYHAHGPVHLVLQGRKQKFDGLNTFAQEISKFDLVVNLLSTNKDDILYLYNCREIFNAQYPIMEFFEEHNVHQTREGNKTLLHFKNWKDGKFSLDVASKCIPLVKKVKKAFKNGLSVFIHCRAGWQRTSVFIVICQLLQKKDMLKSKSNEEIRGYIFSILEELSHTAQRRHPNLQQLEVLISDDFIEFMKKCVISQLVNL